MDRKTKRKNVKDGNVAGRGYNIKDACALTVAVFAIIISLSCLLCTVSRQNDVTSSSDHQVEEPTNDTCLKCQELTRGLPDYLKPLTEKLSRKRDEGEEKCCARNTEEMEALLQLVMGKHTPVPETLDTYDPTNFTFSYASAHVHLHASVPYISRPGLVPQFPIDKVALELHSVPKKSSTQHERNVQVMTSGLHILHPGMYYVYSSIRFNPDSVKRCGDFEVQTWEHSVLRNSPKEPESSGVILSSLHTCCDECTRDKETSYTGGTFHLHAGDHLHVEVSGYALIRFQGDASFFGLYMLGANV